MLALPSKPQCRPSPFVRPSKTVNRFCQGDAWEAPRSLMPDSVFLACTVASGTFASSQGPVKTTPAYPTPSLSMSAFGKKG
uniref:Uncharacterized protein n=1 Tax=Panagrellus redivivus TaxID=6233 RepID=A0A7E4VKN9_PANRE